MTPLVIAHLYPVEMNIYGDTGNVIALRQRLAWRGIEAVVEQVAVGDPFDFSRADVVFAGGGRGCGCGGRRFLSSVHAEHE